MNVKDRIYQIVSDNSLSVEEKYAKIQELLHGKGNGAGSSSGGTGEGAGGGESSSSSGGSKSGDGNDSGNDSSDGQGNDSDNQNGQGKGDDSGDPKGQSQGQGQGQNGDSGEDGEDGSGSGQEGDDKDQNGKGTGSGQGEGDSGDESGEDGQSGGGKSGDDKNQTGQGQNGGSEEDGDSSDDSDGDSQGQGQGQNGNSQNQNQQNQNPQNQNGQNQQNQKQDPEEWLKDLDLGKKQRYQKAKGDGSDDPIVNGLPPGEVEDDDDDDQQGGFGGQMPEEFDDYLAGKYIGIAYAKEVFKGRGVKPTYGYVYDLPDVEQMKLIESMLTESDTDIRSILSGGGDDTSKTDAIYKLLFPDSDDVKSPEDVIMMRNGDVSLEDWGNDDHIISKELGDEIKKEIKEMPNSVNQDIKEIDPEWGATGSDGEVQERMKYIKKLLDPNYIQDKWKRDVAKKLIEKFGARIEKNSEGFVDWKKSLEDFLFDISSHRENGRIKKNLYTFSGIGARHKKRIYDSIGKVVIYADTSGSAYSFCSTMIAEVSKMARDCDIEEFDIHLFTDTVYAEHFGIDRDTISSDEFGFEDVQSGGTSLNNVYNHIVENYIDGYELDEDVSAIIIMTDVDGIEDSGRIDKSEYFKNILDQMLYLLFDPAETTQRALQKLLPKGCKYIAITPSMLHGSDTNIGESANEKKGSSLLEAIGKNLDSVKDKLYNTETDDEKRRTYMKRQNVGAMRDLGRLDQLVPEIFKSIQNNIPELKSVNNVDYFEDTENTFYIDDDLRVWIHKDFVGKADVSKLMSLCNEIKVYKLVGNVSIVGDYQFTNLPAGFPEIIEGKFTMNKLPRLESLDNVPSRMTDYYINIHDSRRHFGELVNQAEEKGLNVEVNVSSSIEFQSKFRKATNENMKMNEAVGKSLGAVKQKLNKAADADDEQKKEYLRKTNIRAMRDLGRMDQLVPEIFAAMNEILPEVKIVQNVDYFEDTENTFYIDDDLRLWIHKDFSTREDARRLLDLCKKTDVFMVIGSVIIQNMPALMSFPDGFPKEIKGLFKLRELINLRNFDNAPKVIYGEEYPSIDPKSRWIRQSALDKYIESITDKQNKSVNVFNLLRLGKDTNESMNTIKESEIAKRFAIGQRYLGEAFPKPLNPLFRSSIPQEPKYPDMPDAPSREDYPDTEEGEKKFIGAQKKYDAIKAKRERGQQRYEDAVTEYNEKLRPLYRRNSEIFHSVITPLIDADWGSIKDSDVVRLEDFDKIHTDLTENRKSFQGVKIFADDNREISLVYAKTINDKTPRVVYFRDEEGNGITDPYEIKQDILRRDAIYKKVDEYFVNKLNFKWDDLPSIKEDYPTVEEVFLNILFWSLANINGTDTSGRKQFKVDDVLYNENGLDKNDLFTEYVRSIFDGKASNKNKSAYIIRGVGTANFEATRSNGPGRALLFIKLVREVNRNNASFNPAVYFTDDAIRAILLGLVVRAEYEGKKKYTTDEIIYADRDQLIEMAYDVLDFNIYRSSLKYMTYSGKRVDISSNASVENPQCVLLLFPDVCRTEYIVNIDINESVLNNYEKRALRQVNRAGMSSTIKKYDYDYRTGQRTRNDIVGNTKKVNVDMTTLDQFEHYAQYFKDAKLNDINKIAKEGIENFNREYSWNADSKMYKNYISAIADIKGYPDLIISELKNNPDRENDKELELLIDLYSEIQDSFEELYNQDPSKPQEVESIVKRILQQAEKIRRMYSVISGVKDSRRTQAISKIISRADRRGNSTISSKAVEDKVYDMTPFSDAIEAAANDYASVKRILNTIDFTNADEDAIDEFGSKDELIRRITKNIDPALAFARAIVSGDDAEKAENMMPDFKELGEILDSIVGFNADMDNPDKAVTKTAIELEDVARKIAREAKKYVGTSSQQAGFTA